MRGKIETLFDGVSHLFYELYNTSSNFEKIEKLKIKLEALKSTVDFKKNDAQFMSAYDLSILRAKTAEYVQFLENELEKSGE